MLKFFILLTILGWAATLVFAIYFVVRGRREKTNVSNARGFPVILLDEHKKGTA